VRFGYWNGWRDLGRLDCLLNLLRCLDLGKIFPRDDICSFRQDKINELFVVLSKLWKGNSPSLDIPLLPVSSFLKVASLQAEYSLGAR
jgi:hypothetical protein